MKKEDLLKIIHEDSLWLLDIASSVSWISSDDRLVESFEMINRFFQEHGRVPASGWWIQEHSLCARLQSIRGDISKVCYLKERDMYGLLPDVNKHINSVGDIFQDDDMGILMDEMSIFNLKFVKRNEERAPTDYIARRKPCRDFGKYELWFRDCHEDIRLWKRVLGLFRSEKAIQQWIYFVLDGILLYIAKIQKEFTNKKGERDGRLLCIFENGTESSMLLSSLWRAMRDSENGRVVSESMTETNKRLSLITEDDTKTGYIYIAKSLSKDIKIQSISNLYKVWFSSVPVEDRIKNASQETTYLMTPVKICMTVECYNMSPQKFEKNIHILLGKYCVNLDVFDKEGRRHSPREWFSVPMETIESAIDMILKS